MASNFEETKAELQKAQLELASLKGQMESANELKDLRE